MIIPASQFKRVQVWSIVEKALELAEGRAMDDLIITQSQRELLEGTVVNPSDSSGEVCMIVLEGKPG
jgi:hypothetical protein